MRTMTKEQAEYFIKAGYFPDKCDIDAIVDLQDVYGHQSYWDIMKWLYNSETAENAERLYRLIWNSEDIDRMVKERDHIKALQASHMMFEIELAKLDNELARYKHIIE